MRTVLTCLAMGLSFFHGLAALAIGDDRPNVVFILADDLGINDLSCYGRKDQQTPVLDKLATEGVRFTAAYAAQPICSPSRAALMTGKAPARLHLTTYLPGRPDAPSQKLLHPKIEMHLPADETTIAQRFRSAGYATACVGKWHLGEGPGFSPRFRGFDLVHPGQPNTKPSETEGGKGEFDLTRTAIEFIEKNRDQPFFLYLAHNSPHIPFTAQKRRIDKYKDSFNPTYAGVIDSLDETVGIVLAKLDALKLAKKTIVVFTSDNGGLHVPEGQITPATHNSSFRAGKGFVYEGGLRVPLIVRWPGHFPAGKVNHTPIVDTDWAATWIELCGLKPDVSLDGRSIVKALMGEELPEKPLFWHFPHYTNQGSKPAGAARSGNWKLVEHYEDGSHELYDLSKDEGESQDISRLHPDIVMKLANDLDAWRKSVGAQINQPNPAFDKGMHDKIYVDFDVSKLKPAPTAEAMRPGLEKWRTLMDQAIRAR